MSSAVALVGVSLTALTLALGHAVADDIINGQTVTVPGDQNSPWDLGVGKLLIGFNDEGALVIENGGIVMPAELELGILDTGTGTATISGISSALNSTLAGGVSRIGLEGTGVVTVNSGASFNTAGSLLLGEFTGSSGTLNVAGNGSSANIAQDMAVGVSGDGIVNVTDGATVTNGGTLVLGQDSGHNGTIDLSGDQTNWAASQFAIVGNAGNGQVFIEGGANMDVGQNLILGNATTAIGSVLVTGPGSQLNFADGFVGFNGDGLVSVENGGSFGAAGNIALASGADSNGHVQLSGAGTTMSADLVTVGDEGNAIVTVSDGARLETGITTLGRIAGSHGAVSLAGGGTVWANTLDDIYIGREGEGTVLVANGARLQTISYVRLGTDAGGKGTLSLTGPGTTLEAGVTVEVGQSGLGQATVENGASLKHGHDLSIGTSAGGMGSAVVSGSGSTWQGLGDATIGQSGVGTFVIKDGGYASIAGDTVVGSLTGGGGLAVDGGTFSTGTLTVGDAGDGTLIVQDGGIVTVGSGTILVAVQAGSTGHIGIGNGGGAGVIAAEKLQFGTGDVNMFFAHTDTDYRFDPILEGNGMIDHGGGHTTFTADSSGFLGTTTIWGGTLAVDGVLGGMIDVDPDGKLGGSGTVGDVTVASGGMVAPGNSIGTLNVGDIVFDAGSELQVEVDGVGNADLVNAAGTATINGGNVAVSPFPDIATGTPYTIVTSAGGVTGDFDTATFGNNSLFITPTLTSDLNNVYVTLTQTTDFADVALTPNQMAAADGIQSVASGEAFSAIAALGDAAQARDAFDAISGEIHASAKTAWIEDSRYLREAALNRLRSTLGSVGADAATAPLDQLEFWGQGFGAFGEWDSDGNAAALERSLGGFVLGGDTALSDWRFGLMAGYGHSGFDVDDQASSGSAASYHLGAYGGTDINGLGLTFGGAYSWHDMEIDRTAAFTGFSDALSANYWSGTGQIFGELGYAIDAGPARFEPFVNLAHIRHSTDGFSEDGGSAAVSGGDETTNATYATLGMRAETELTLGDGNTAKLTGMLGWRHAFGDTTPEANLNFAGGDAFTIAGVPVARNALVLETGVEAAVSPTATFGLNYSGQLASEAQDHSLKASFNAKF